MPELVLFPPTPYKSSPVIKPIPPPYPYYDDSNYLQNGTTTTTTSRTRRNILNLINESSSATTPDHPDCLLLNSLHTTSNTSAFNSLSRNHSRCTTTDDNSSGGGHHHGRGTVYDRDVFPDRSFNSLDRVQHHQQSTFNVIAQEVPVAGRSATAQRSRDESAQSTGTGAGGSTSSSALEHVDITSTVSRSWEYVNVNLTRVPGYGFGIAVSGGCDNPHFANGDPAIAISDVLKGGPAQGKLQINDRIVSANGISLDNVDYSTAVQILRDSGPSVALRVKRRVSPQTYKVAVPLNTKRLKKLSFESLGFSVTVTLQVKTIDTPSLGLREGDLIDKIQGIKVNDLFNEKVVCKELKRVLDESGSGGGSSSTPNSSLLHLTVKRSGNRNAQVQQQQLQQQATLQQQHQHQSNAGPHHLQTVVGNLYVQPPTRQNNKSFDSTNTPLPPPPPPPRPPLPQEDEMVVGTTSNPLRSINFIKQNQLGIRLSGGNKTGILVSAVQKNSQADLQGLTVNDKIIRVNEHDFVANRPTREQAIELLSSIPNDTLVNLTVEKMSGGSVVAGGGNQDEFYIRSRIATEDVLLHELLLITDTLVNGLVGHWEAHRVDHQGNVLRHAGTRVIIPNMKGARELMKKGWKRTTSFRSREYEELLQCGVANEPYDMVEKSSVDMSRRPVVLWTPLNGTLIECLMMMKQATRMFKVVKSVDALEFNDGRVRVVQELMSVKQLQELHDQRIYPYVVFGNFSSKDSLKEACEHDGKMYSRVKKLVGVLAKLRDKLGSYVDLDLGALRDCESGADSLYRSVARETETRGSIVFVASTSSCSQSSSSNGGGSAAAPTQSSSSSTPRKQSYQRSSSSRHNHTPQPSTPRSENNNSMAQQTATSPSPASLNSLKFPNFNIPPPCSIIDQQPEYDKRVNLQRSATTLGIPAPSQQQQQPPPQPIVLPTTPVQNNFAHSPVLDRREFTGDQQQLMIRRAQSNPPPPTTSYQPPPMIDRSKKPSGAFYPVVPANQPAQPSTPSSKPVPPPKPKLISSTTKRPPPSRESPKRSFSTELSPQSPADDVGQTYLNIPMNSKVVQQQQQQQQQSSLTSGYFDWRGGRLVQKHVFGNQIPIEVYIPENAIPHGETVNVWFQIVDYNVRDDTSTPKKMLSPLVKFGPENYRFQIPVEIRIPQYSANNHSLNDNMLAKVLMNNHSDYWTKIDIQNGNYPNDNSPYPSDVKVVSLTVQQF